ncbi:hypothetical protein HBA54_24550 [Pelagibius litoralis]|uniref:Uncharacterized protein n=1 Tax=Pelagibius litoralis TaxID=374515 RepID=A0A967F2M1_9PROT|nr:hypothetical protein [Pelagibius litoralis]NIA71770.1 hypothetical protein [Pelagibius litoralis]
MLTAFRRHLNLVGTAMLIGLLHAVPGAAAQDVSLNTRFIQGSFDLLLPDSWIASLDESGTVLLAEGPDYNFILLSTGWEDNEELFLFHDLRATEIRATGRLHASMVRNTTGGPDETRQSVLALSMVTKGAFGSTVIGDPVVHHVQISRPGRSGIFASVAYEGGIEAVAPRAATLRSILDSLKVMDAQATGSPSYQHVRKRDAAVWPEAEDVVGDWEGGRVRGDVLLEEDNFAIAALSSGSPDIELRENGRYVSKWSHFDFDVMTGESTLEITHKESGRWRLDRDRLQLTPSRYEGEVKAKGEVPEIYDEDVTVTRHYDVMLGDGVIILRGVCAEYQMLPGCIDPFTGNPRILGFVLEPRR